MMLNCGGPVLLVFGWKAQEQLVTFSERRQKVTDVKVPAYIESHLSTSMQVKKLKSRLTLQPCSHFDRLLLSDIDGAIVACVLLGGPANWNELGSRNSRVAEIFVSLQSRQHDRIQN